MISDVGQHRVLSGMRPTGRLHLGHYRGVLKNWIRLQNEHECWFFVADWHALTTMHHESWLVPENSFDTVIDWLASGINPAIANIFIQSQVPEHAELNLILGMITPLGWLERVPSYKDYLAKNDHKKNPASFGFLGYPVLQSADILLYRSSLVPVGADQAAHVEVAREIARHFNFLYGRKTDFKEAAEAAIPKLGKKLGALYRKLAAEYQEKGDHGALERGQALLTEHSSLSIADQERLSGYLSGGGRVILPEPEVLLTEASKIPGLDGEKMSKSSNNTITLRDTNDEIARKIRVMKTDPARIKRADPGNPDHCPVAELHRTYSDQATQDWMAQGCRHASIGCVDCKKPLIEAIQAEVTPIRKEAEQLKDNRDYIVKIISEGVEKAREAADRTLEEVRDAMGMSYR